MKKAIAAVLALLLCVPLSTCAIPEQAVPDYDRLLVEAVLSGDTAGGRAIAAERNAGQRETGGAAVDFDELLLLSRLIQAQAGEPRFCDELRMSVGQVALNRVASPEYPDSLEEVVYQRGQYSFTLEPEFGEMLPQRASTRAALRLLSGEQVLAPQVLFQAPYRMGPIYAKFYDAKLDVTTYFCESMRRELYEQTQG